MTQKQRASTGIRSIPRDERGKEPPPQPVSAGRRPSRDSEDMLCVPVLAEGADPGRTVPGPLAVRDRLLIDRQLVDRHAPERLFAYEVTRADMKHLRGLASPGDRIVFRRGGRVTADRICAVRTAHGVRLARVLFKENVVLLLPGDGEREFDSLSIEGLAALPGVIAGTHVLLLRR